MYSNHVQIKNNAQEYSNCCKPQMPMGPVTGASGLWGGELSCWRALWGHTFIPGSREALVFEWLQLWLLNLDTWRIAQKSS